jgi:hypothetical protein
MKLELEPEEARVIMDLVVDCLPAEAGLSEEDRAALRRWQAGVMRPASDGMRELTAKLNAEIARTLQTKARSAIVKHDWQ